MTNRIKYTFNAWKKANKNAEHPLAEELDALKKKLQSQQRQLAVGHWLELISEISKASTENKQLLSKLVI